MRIVVFGPTRRVGLLLGDRVLDLAAAVAADPDREALASLSSLIDAGERGLDLVRGLGEGHADSDDPTILQPVDTLRLRAPFAGRRFALAGSNNADHVANAWRNRGIDVTADKVRERTRSGPAGGFWVVDAPVGPRARIPIPHRADGLFDFEGELAIVLSRGGRRIRAEDWRDHVWGATLVIDWSVRHDDPSKMQRPFYGHKIFDAAKSMGPWIAVDEVDPADCVVTTQVNGERRQHFSTADMIHSYAEILEQVSTDLTFRPGDCLAGGTGPGTAYDSSIVRDGLVARDLFLKPGDEVVVSADALGELAAVVVEPL